MGCIINQMRDGIIIISFIIGFLFGAIILSWIGEKIGYKKREMEELSGYEK